MPCPTCRCGDNARRAPLCPARPSRWPGGCRMAPEITLPSTSDPSRVDVATVMADLQGRVRAQAAGAAGGERIDASSRTRRSSTPSPACSGAGSMRATAASCSCPSCCPTRKTGVSTRRCASRPTGPLIGGALLFVKTRVLLPLNRWLYRYTREHFRRQHQVNLALFACLESLAIENARLRQDVDALRRTDPASSRPARRGPVDEARVCRPPLRHGRHRRIRSALPIDRRTPRPAARRHRADDVREELRHLAQRVPGGGDERQRRPRAPVSGASGPAICTRSTTSVTWCSPAPRRSRSRRAGSTRTALRARPDRSPANARAVPTTGSSSGPTATTRRSTACRPYRERAVLVPTAEEDPLIHAPILSSYFARPRALSLPHARGTRSRDRRASTAPLRRSASSAPASRRRPPRRAARCSTLWAFPSRSCSTWAASSGTRVARRCCATSTPYLAEGRTRIPLVMAGPAIMPIPEHPLIRPLGYVPDAVRDALLAHARALVVPSPYESLSMVLLEAWNHGRASAGERTLPRAQGAGRARGRRPALRQRARVLRRRWSCSCASRTSPARWAHRGGPTLTASTRWPVVMDRLESLLARHKRLAGGPSLPARRWLQARAPGSGAVRSLAQTASGAENATWSLEPGVRPTCHRVQQFLRRDRRGAELADDHACGVVGEAGGFGRGAAGGERQAERRDDRVAGAGHIRHFARGGRQVPL